MSGRAERRAVLGMALAGGLADYVHRLRQKHQATVTSGMYRGCICGDPICDRDVLLAWCDDLIEARRVKVADFHAEVQRTAAVRRLARDCIDQAQTLDPAAVLAAIGPGADFDPSAPVRVRIEDADHRCDCGDFFVFGFPLPAELCEPNPLNQDAIDAYQFWLVDDRLADGRRRCPSCDTDDAA